MAVTDVKTYQTFRGVDYSASPAVISEEHASDMLNMYIGADGVLQKRPGWHILKTFQAEDSDDTRLPVNGIHYVSFAPGNGMLFIHAGIYLFSVLMATSWRHVTGEDRPYFQYEGDVPTLDDVRLIEDYVAGNLSGLEAWQVKNMDINGDGRVTKEDAKILNDYIVNVAHPASNGVLSKSYTIVKKKDGSVLHLANTRSVAFEHDGNLYLLDGSNYYKISPNYAGVENLLDTSTQYNGVIQADGTLQ